MLILDTDHMSEFIRGSVPGSNLRERLAVVAMPKATTIVTAEELLRGRLAQSAKARASVTLGIAYRRLQDTLEELRNWPVLPFDGAAIEELDRLHSQRLGIGTMDLRIAAIVLAGGHTLLSRNLRDFERVPNLKVEDWLAA